MDHPINLLNTTQLNTTRNESMMTINHFEDNGTDSVDRSVNGQPPKEAVNSASHSPRSHEEEEIQQHKLTQIEFINQESNHMLLSQSTERDKLPLQQLQRRHFQQQEQNQTQSQSLQQRQSHQQEPIPQQGYVPLHSVKQGEDWTHSDVVDYFETRGLTVIADEIRKDPAANGKFLLDTDIQVYVGYLDIPPSSKATAQSMLFDLFPKKATAKKLPPISISSSSPSSSSSITLSEGIYTGEDVANFISSKHKDQRIAAIRGALSICEERNISDKAIFKLTGISTTMLARARGRALAKGSTMGSSLKSVFPHQLLNDSMKTTTQLNKLIEIAFVESTSLDHIIPCEIPTQKIPKIKDGLYNETKQILDRMYERYMGLDGRSRVTVYDDEKGGGLKDLWEVHITSPQGSLFSEASPDWVMNQMRARSKKIKAGVPTTSIREDDATTLNNVLLIQPPPPPPPHPISMIETESSSSSSSTNKRKYENEGRNNFGIEEEISSQLLSGDMNQQTQGLLDGRGVETTIKELNQTSHHHQQQQQQQQQQELFRQPPNYDLSAMSV